MGNFKAGNRASHKEQETMDQLYALIANCGQQELEDVANDMLIRKTFGRDDMRSEQMQYNGSRKPRRRKFAVDDSGMQRNSQLANKPMACNENAPNHISGSLHNLFNGSTQAERCQSESVRGPMQRVRGF